MNKIFINELTILGPDEDVNEAVRLMVDQSGFVKQSIQCFPITPYVYIFNTDGPQAKVFCEIGKNIKACLYLAWGTDLYQDGLITHPAVECEGGSILIKQEIWQGITYVPSSPSCFEFCRRLSDTMLSFTIRKNMPHGRK